MPSYKLLKDAYYGEGGFIDGQYLEQHGRETTANYEKRKAMAYYYNYFAAIVNALVDPIFRKTPDRSWPDTGTAGTLISAFVDNVDNQGTKLNAFMADAAMKARLLGACYICMENFQDVPATVDKALASRKMPYAYIVEPEFVTDWEYDNYGNLTKFVFSEPVEGGGDKQITRKVVFDDTHVTIMENETVKSSVEHGLGRIPVIPFPARLGSRRTIQPASEMEPLARCALAQFNYMSYLGEILRNQTFSILVVPGGNAKDINIGTNNAISYDADITGGAAPAFIAPPSAPADTLIAQIKAMTEEMYRIAGLSFITGTKQESSGVAKAWEFERTNQTLAAYAQRCRDVELQVMDLFQRYCKITSKYEVTYANDFGIVDVANEITTAQSVLDLELTSGLREQVLEKVINAYLPDITDQDHKKILDMFKQDEQDKQYQQPVQQQVDPTTGQPVADNTGAASA